MHVISALGKRFSFKRRQNPLSAAMNQSFITSLFAEYKNSFQTIHSEEFYKWAAVAQFQSAWNISSEQFPQMLDSALSRTRNLLASGSYYPRRMIVKFADRNPEAVRELFRNLFDEEKDLITRIREFQAQTESLLHPGEDLNTYQDHRAVIVYLCLRYPERYFLYKFEMFKEFASLAGLAYRPKRGAEENILQFYSTCNIIRDAAIADNELLLLHQRRLNRHDYADPAFTLLTQDIIYAAVQHLQIHSGTQDQTVSIQVTSIEIVPEQFEPSLSGVFINYLDNQREATRIGGIGERLILEYEKRKLRDAGIFSRIPSHDAVNIGDGIGYDIKSYTIDGDEMFIEVKATRGPFDSTFYITRNELVKSRQASDSYYLYRLYDINERDGSAKLVIRRGNLDSLCINPAVYTVILRRDQ